MIPADFGAAHRPKCSLSTARPLGTAASAFVVPLESRRGEAARTLGVGPSTLHREREQYGP